MIATKTLRHKSIIYISRYPAGAWQQEESFEAVALERDDLQKN